MKTLIAITAIEEKIFVIRGQKVMLDADLAELYGVSTKVLNQAVKRNQDRFPKDFMFQLNENEADNMRSQIVTASDPGGDIRSQIATTSKRNIRFLPYAFTEHGAIMAASVLNSKRAVDVSIYVVRAFVKLRQMLAANKELAHKLTELEHKVVSHDGTIQALVAAIRKLMTPPETKEQKEKKIGFVKESRTRYRPSVP
jgi:hypothetical protein